MKVFVLCNSDILASNAILQLFQTAQLAGVGVPDKHADHLSRVFQSMGIHKKDIHVLYKHTLASTLADLITAVEANCIITLTFPWKIPAAILTQPKQGCINFHFGKLPLYRGADPIFWQIKNQETSGGISVHLMTEAIDEGAILHIADLPIAPGETYGIHSIRLAMLAAELALQLPAIVQMPPQKQLSQTNTAFFKAPGMQTLTINWLLQTADAIIALINASNPKYHGAITYIKQQPIRVLEAAIAHVNTTETFTPGTIVHADITHGIIAACINQQFISISIVHIKEGYLSGIKLFTMGLTIGEKFL